MDRQLAQVMPDRIEAGIARAKWYLVVDRCEFKPGNFCVRICSDATPQTFGPIVLPSVGLCGEVSLATLASDEDAFFDALDRLLPEAEVEILLPLSKRDFAALLETMVQPHGFRCWWPLRITLPETRWAMVVAIYAELRQVMPDLGLGVITAPIPPKADSSSAVA